MIFIGTKPVFLCYQICYMKAKGTLIPIGGNEDKGIETADHYKLEYIEDGILSRVVKESGGIKASIVVIPTASSYPGEVGKNYLKAFGKLNCHNVQVLDIRERSQSESSENLDIIRKADCVMFSGGNQSKITGKIAGTEMHHLLLKKYRKEKFVSAGTISGARCMAENYALFVDEVLTHKSI